MAVALEGDGAYQVVNLPPQNPAKRLAELAQTSEAIAYITTNHDPITGQEVMIAIAIRSQNEQLPAFQLKLWKAARAVMDTDIRGPFPGFTSDPWQSPPNPGQNIPNHMKRVLFDALDQVEGKEVAMVMAQTVLESDRYLPKNQAREI